MYNAQNALDQVHNFPEESIPEQNLLQALKFNASKLVVGVTAQSGPLAIMESEENIREILLEMRRLEESDDIYEGITGDSEEELASLKQLEILSDSLSDAVERFQQAIHVGSLNDYHQTMLQRAWLQFDSHIDVRISDELGEFQANYDGAQRMISDNRTNSFVIIGLGLAALVLISFMLERLIVHPIHRLDSFLGEMVQKQEFEIIPVKREDEIGTLTRSFNNLIANLNGTLENLKDTNKQLTFTNSLMTQRNLELEERNQQAMEQSEKIDIQNKDLRGFAHVVSHDLKTPLRGMVNLSNWLKDEYKDQLDERGQEYLDLITERSAYLYELVNGILSYSTNADLEFKSKEDINFSEFIRNTFQIIAPSGEVDFIFPQDDQTLSISRVALQQIFQNLLGNAINYNDKPIPRIEVGFEETEENYFFTVLDNGPGIDIKYQEKVFRLFQTLGQKGRNNQDGTGIGLALVKRIVEKLDGRIELSSSLGKGCMFSVWIKK